VNKPGEDYGFGQSILKPSVLVFDTPPYTTQQGVSILELPSEWARDAPPKSNKAPYIFKPSLLADLSHTSSSIPSYRSDKMSTLGSTWQSSKVSCDIDFYNSVTYNHGLFHICYLVSCFLGKKIFPTNSVTFAATS